MAQTATAARPYARAAFASAAEAQRPTWSNFLTRAAAVVEDARVVALLDNPRIEPTQLVAFVLELASTAASPTERAEQQNFLHLLADNHRLRLLPEIARQFEALRAEAEHVADVEVITALALSDAQSQQLKTTLERRLGRAVRLHTRIDKSLIGGAIVQRGDFVVDGSLRGRIERLSGAMSGP